MGLMSNFSLVEEDKHKKINGIAMVAVVFLKYNWQKAPYEETGLYASKTTHDNTFRSLVTSTLNENALSLVN